MFVKRHHGQVVRPEQGHLIRHLPAVRIAVPVQKYHRAPLVDSAAPEKMDEALLEIPDPTPRLDGYRLQFFLHFSAP